MARKVLASEQDKEDIKNYLDELEQALDIYRVRLHASSSARHYSHVP